VQIQPSTTGAKRHTDLASSIAATMRRMQVSALPRNYEIFYEALTNPNSELADALAALGTPPPQKKLDALADEFLGRQQESVVADVHGEIMRRLEEIIQLLRKEQSALEKYGRLLDETSSGLSGREVVSREFLQRVACLMTTATDTTIDHGRKIASSMNDKSSELAEVKQKLEAYKKLADTDALTRLNNRRSFDREIASIYDDKRKMLFSCLILADIDRFKPINDKHGHPVGDRILQIVAGIFASRTGRQVFVARTGGEEFALILEGFTEDSATKMADEIRAAVENTPFVNVTNGANYGPITVSFGLCMASEAEGPDDLYIKADRALYASKSSGRNRVTRFSQLAGGSFVKNWFLYRNE
jgi:diguanylate cyclase